MGSDEAFPRDFDRLAADVIERHVARMESHHVAVAMRHLGQQLTIAAGLCEAFRLGKQAAESDMFTMITAWHPGYGRSFKSWWGRWGR